MEHEPYEVTSELYSEYNYTTDVKPTVSPNNVVSKFKFTRTAAPQTDADGDFVVERKTNVHEVEIEHSRSTLLHLVGQQIWRGAFLLADWLIYNGTRVSDGGLVLELGSGVGLTGIVGAMYNSVICSDVNKGDILNLIKSNVERNKSLINFPVDVLELDFFCDDFSPEMTKLLPNVHIILAADIVYDDLITAAFVNVLDKMLSMSSKIVAYVALEKRYVFTVVDCETCAPCYEYFLECLRKLKGIDVAQLPIDFPQYFQYDRVKELVLWKISSRN